ncbi:reverse transcriptase domain-containing protein [Tanacetum coccineum]
MQQHGRGLVTSHFRRTSADQLASAEGDLRPQEIISITWFSTRSTPNWRHPWDPYTTTFPKILTMSGPAELNLTPPTSAVRNTVGREKEQTSKNSDRPASDAALREYCDKHYHQLLPIIAEKVHNEKVQQEKLKEVKARLNFEGCSGRNSKIQETSQYSESRTPNKRGDLRRRLKPRRSRIGDKRRREGNVFHRLGDRGRSVSAHSESRYQGFRPRRAELLSESEDSEGGHWKSKSRKQKSSIEEEDLSQPWTCEEANPFTPRIRYFELRKKSRMPNNVKTYDGSDDPEDHLKIFQAAAKVERWTMPTWCHMFNSTLTGSAKKCIKDPVEIHHIKQREGESTKDFVQRFKAKSRHVKGAPEWMRISGFMHGITNPELIKRLYDNIPKSVDEMMRITTTFLRGEVAASNQARKKAPPTWKQQEVGRKQNFDRKGDFRNQQRSERRLGHNTDECMHLKRQIEELIKNGKLSHVIKELKQGRGKDQPKTTKKGEASGKDKPLAILIVQPWQRVARQKVTQSFSSSPEISFPPVGDEDGTEGLMIIEAEIGGHFIHRIYVDGGSASEILYEHSSIGFVRKAFHLYNDELCGSKITVSIQRDHRKARSEEDPSSPVNSSRNAKIPSPMRDSNKGKNQSGHSSRAPRTNNCNRLHPNKGRTEGIVKTKEKKLDTRKKQSNTRGGGKLVDAGIMKKVHYHSWLSNPVMVKKHDDSWRMCVDFKDLNKSCPKDGYPLPEIDWKVESLYGYSFKCFLDAYKGYQQIKMAKEDEEKTVFITSQEIFCYSKMPFGLKNAGDLPASGRQSILKTDWQKFRGEINMKLNPKKCTFGIEEGMFLGYKVNTKGIKLIAELPTLTAPMEKEELIVYLAATREAVSAVLMAEREAKQMPVYFVSRALQGPEINYTSMEKLYRPRTSVKGQILVDFIVERPEDDFPDTPMEAEEELSDPWILFTDGSSCVDGSRAGLILTDPEGGEFTYALRFRFEATNNEAEYEALIAGLKIAEQIGVKNLQVSVDSCLVANQVNGSYIAKEPVMVLYLDEVKTLSGGFKKCSIKQVPRSENKKGDGLSKIASTSFAHLNKQALVEELSKKSINIAEVLTVVEEEGDTWMTPIYKYLTEETLPAEKEKARAIRRKSGRYAVVIGILYKKSYLSPWLRCLEPLKSNYVLREIHEGSCSMHAGTIPVVAKAIRIGYYWPIMHADARKQIQEC